MYVYAMGFFDESGRPHQTTGVIGALALSRPGEGGFTLVVKLVPGGPASEYLRALPVGGRVRFTGPMGFFVNELAHSGDVVYIATGTGIAPLLPMIEETLRRSETGRVILFWGLRSEADVFYQDELSALSTRTPRFTHQIYLSQPQSFCRLRGRVTGPVLELLPGLREPTFYLCGNGQMIEELKAGLVARGVSRKRQIRTEAFCD